MSISGLEMIQNSGKEAIIDLLDGRMEVAEAQLANRISGDLYGDGTGNAGKNLTGLAAAVPDSIAFEYWDDEGNQYDAVPEGQLGFH